MIVHGGLLALRVHRNWSGVLIEGPSGSGKSDLALRCLQADFRLVADDRVVLWTSNGKLYGKAPEPLAGLIEARGLGVVFEAALPFVEVRLLAVAGTDIERVPAPELTESRAGIELATLKLAFLENSAPAKLGRALYHLG